MSPLTLAELRLVQARLALRAERLRQQWRNVIPTEPRATSLGRQCRDAQSRADEYASIIRVAEGMT